MGSKCYEDVNNPKWELQHSINNREPFQVDYWDRYRYKRKANGKSTLIDWMAFSRELAVLRKIKKLQEDNIHDPRFQYLARITKAEFDHPGYFQQGRTCANIEQEACLGGDLMVFATSRPRPTLFTFQIISFIGQLSLGVEALSDNGYLHADLKLENAVIDHHGRVKIVDLGLAKHVNKHSLIRNVPMAQRQGNTRRGSFCGTMHYISPEKMRGQKYGTPDDIYALGVILYTLRARIYPNANRRICGQQACCRNSVDPRWRKNDRRAWERRYCPCWIRLRNRVTKREYDEKIENLVNWMMHPNPEKRMTLNDFWNSSKLKWIDKVIKRQCRDIGIKTRTNWREELLQPKPQRAALCDSNTQQVLSKKVLEALKKISRGGRIRRPELLPE